MKVVILAGGLGTRISEESQLRPKPMIEIGGKPILWHIMKIYSHYGINEFIICLGYKGHIIKEYFANYFLYNSDVTFDMESNTMDVHQNAAEPWKVTLVDTGEDTNTGGRLKSVKNYLDDDTFCMTYGDGLCNIDISKLISFHKEQKTKATLTAIQPPSRFGAIDFKKHKVKHFEEKPAGNGGWINGGFFVLHKDVLDLIKGDQIAWENEPVDKLAINNELSAFKHSGFWHCMDTLRDKIKLEELWESGEAPWKVW
jgi:glucose-1-phosphate cytidylyltransferase